MPARLSTGFYNLYLRDGEKVLRYKKFLWKKLMMMSTQGTVSAEYPVVREKL